MLTKPHWGSYNGDFVNNIPEGNGVSTHPNGMKYDGQWLNGKRHGIGVIYTSNESQPPRTAIFENDKQMCVGSE